ncbi:MAG: EVE domain-containing protein [Gemmatimonadota bacterium]
MAKSYWLMKSEPAVYSIDDLARDGTTYWDSIRNYQARNNMRAMAVGDEVLFYHSQSSPPGVAGIARVVREAYPDHTQFDATHKYFDPKSDEAKPRWWMVDVEFVSAFDEVLPLRAIKADPALGEMVLVRNSRLSVQPVAADEFQRVVALANA